MGLIWFLGIKKSENPSLIITAQVEVVISWKVGFNFWIHFFAACVCQALQLGYKNVVEIAD